MLNLLFRSRSGRTCSALWIAISASAAASAQEVRERDIEDVEAPRSWTFRIDSNSRHIFKHDLDDGGDVSITRSGLGLSFGLAMLERASLNLDLEGEYSHYNFGGDTTLSPDSSDPFDDFYSTTFSPSVFIQLEDRWTALTGGSVRFAGESGARFSESITGSVYGVLGRQVSESLFLAAGLLVSTRLEDDPRVIPLIGVDWRFHEDWRLHTQGPGLSLTYAASETMDLSLRGRWESREYRLSPSDDVLSRGAFEDDRILASAELAWRPAEQVRLRLECGGAVYQKLKTIDRHGDRISRQVNDPALFLGLSVSISF